MLTAHQDSSSIRNKRDLQNVEIGRLNNIVRQSDISEIL